MKKILNIRFYTNVNAPKGIRVSIKKETLIKIKDALKTEKRLEEIAFIPKFAKLEFLEFYDYELEEAKEDKEEILNNTFRVKNSKVVVDKEGFISFHFESIKGVILKTDKFKI